MTRAPLPKGTLAALALLAAAALTLACAGSAPPAASYHCPMHPTVVQDRPGDCPVCGMRLVPTEAAAPAAPVTYLCPMHPEVTSPKPADCPICGMHLVPKRVETAPSQGGLPGRAPVSLSEGHRRALNLATAPAEVRRISREVRTSARITPDETRLHHVTTKVEGWVEHLYVNATGQAVRRGQPLLTLYSPELLATQEEYLSALRASERLAQSPVPGVAQGGQDLMRAARRRLELWDISEAQIAALESSGTAQRSVTLFAPASGYVSEKTVVMGHKVMPGEVLLSVIDLSTVWAEADIYESDLRSVAVGMPVTLTLPYWPGKSFPGRISFLNPFLDPMTRTLKARLEVPNPDLLLKPEMLGDMVLAFDLGERLTVPTSAVMRTGQRDVVFVQAGEGELTPVAVTVGERSGDDYEVLSGLKPGDRVVTSANFLVDSESSLKAALQAVSGP